VAPTHTGRVYNGSKDCGADGNIDAIKSLIEPGVLEFVRWKKSSENLGWLDRPVIPSSLFAPTSSSAAVPFGSGKKIPHGYTVRNDNMTA
jgi:hypothetical protein